MGGEVGGLKSEIGVYECHIASLVYDVECLEMNAFHQLKFDAAANSEEKVQPFPFFSSPIL